MGTKMQKKKQKKQKSRSVLAEILRVQATILVLMLWVVPSFSLLLQAVMENDNSAFIYGILWFFGYMFPGLWLARRLQ
jgi:competence protein ComGC